MTMTSQQYAMVSDDSYKNRPTGIREPGKPDPLTLDGVTYNVIEHVNNKVNGYQGTIYQRVDTGEIVVAHRGTEFDQGPRSFAQDVVGADGSMVLGRVNPQAQDAIELTRRAIRYAEADSLFAGRTPAVTVTGHSLGGTLAQITAQHFGLKGETFNAYGAVSLGYQIPKGGSDVINNVMAGDPVSAASTHYGQVRFFAAPKEVETLQRHGYDNDRDWIDIRDFPKAAYDSTDSHRLYNFLDKDLQGRPHLSALKDPAAQSLAREFDPMFDRFRDDVAKVRGGITLMGLGSANVRQLLNEVRGPLEPGEPARLEEEKARRHAPPAIPPFGGRPEDVDRGFQNMLTPGAFGALRDGTQPSGAPVDLQSNPSAFVERMLAAAQQGDAATFRHMTQTAADSDAGRTMRSEAVATVDQQQLVAQHQSLQAEQQTDVHSRGAMRIG